MTSNKKIALITGGNSGIGYATATLLKKHHYEVFISGRNETKVIQAAESIDAVPLVADMSDADAIPILTKPFAETGLDLLVNNAAIARFAPVEMISETEFSEFFHTNVRGPLLLIKHLLPALEQRRGCISFVSSAITTSGLPNASLYAATKGAIDAATRSLAIELAPRHIRVNAVSPGAVDTPIISKLGLNEEMLTKIRSQMESTIPMHRYGMPAEVAEVILAQAESSYVTGSIWAVDGGVAAA